MYGILGEDTSDVNTLKILARKIVNDPSLPIKVKGYDGCAEMLRKGAAQLRLFRSLGCRRMIVCYDADGPDPSGRHAVVERQIIRESQIEEPCCILIPVQELEAWILADVEAVTRIWKSWKPKPILNPERIDSPKEHLERLSRDEKRHQRYHHAIHNERVAEFLDLAKVHQKCPSFRPLVQFMAS